MRHFLKYVPWVNILFLLHVLLHVSVVFASAATWRIFLDSFDALQPYNTYSGEGCNASDSFPCVSGWARKNAVRRAAMRDVRMGHIEGFFRIQTVDDQSSLIQSHPLQLGLHHSLPEEPPVDTYILQSPVLFNPWDTRLISWLNATTGYSPPLTLSNLKSESLLFSSIIKPYTLKQFRNRTILLLAFNPGTDSLSRRFSREETERFLKMLNEIHHPDLTILCVNDWEEDVDTAAQTIDFIHAPLVIHFQKSRTNQWKKRVYTSHVYVNRGKGFTITLDWDFTSRAVRKLQTLQFPVERSELTGGITAYRRDLLELQKEITLAHSRPTPPPFLLLPGIPLVGQETALWVDFFRMSYTKLILLLHPILPSSPQPWSHRCRNSRFVNRKTFIPPSLALVPWFT